MDLVFQSPLTRVDRLHGIIVSDVSAFVSDIDFSHEGHMLLLWLLNRQPCGASSKSSEGGRTCVVVPGGHLIESSGKGSAVLGANIQVTPSAGHHFLGEGVSKGLEPLPLQNRYLISLIIEIRIHSLGIQYLLLCQGIR